MPSMTVQRFALAQLLPKPSVACVHGELQPRGGQWERQVIRNTDVSRKDSS